MEHTKANAAPAKTAANLVQGALTETLARRTISPSTSGCASESSPSKPGSWAQKWLALDLWNPATEQMAVDVEQFCARWFRNKAGCDRVLVLAGHSGCGKTHAMRGALRFADAARVAAAELALWKWPPGTMWENWAVLSRQIVEGGKGIHMHELLADAIETDTLFLDDVGSESDKFRSGETIDALCQLLSRRERKWTMITTNVIPREWPKQFDARVADRLWRNSVVCDLSDSPTFASRPEKAA